MVTARGDESDRVVGLELGADDYLVKPFGFRELVGAHPRRDPRAGAAPGRRRRADARPSATLVDRRPDATAITLAGERARR